uniref:Uncharacterized protein n=1 Tax=uncultured marine virus TaxID=186617 RepID=A0A0F7L984_9VIRU|nr:hypothetical protein [uncultured marine virus]
MTVTATNDRRANVTGDGAILVFAYDFKILANTDLEVYHVSSAGVATLLTLTTDYTVSGVGVAGGGNVTLTAAYAVAGTPASNESILMLGETAKTQLTNLLQNGAYNAEVQEAIGDKLTLIANEFEREQDRSLTLALSDSAVTIDTALPVAVANETFAWSSDATGLVAGPTVSEISGAAASATAASASAAAASSSASSASTDAASTAADVISVAADLVATNQDTIDTAADVVLTAADVVSTAADLVATNQDTIDTAADLVATNQDTIDTAADLVLTNADVVSTNADAVATAADLVLTNADQVSAAASAASAASSAASVPNMDAVAGIIEANANFVDACIFGPAMDPVDWSGGTAASSASLMLATVEDTGADTQVNIWDLTSTTIASASPLATVTITGAATVTSVAASMGYIIVGSEDGISIIDPHSGAWAERTVGWPKSLSTSTIPALGNNDVEKVVAGISNQPPFDPRTGGPMPSFMANLGTTDYVSFLYPDGTVGNYGSPNAVNGIAIAHGRAYFSDTVNTLFQSKDIDGGNVNSGYYILKDNSYPYGFMPDNDLSFGSHGNAAVASADGLSLIIAPATDVNLIGTGNAITRAYNTGYLIGDIRGAWLANSKTVDRSYKANTLTEEGTVTEAVVASGAELLGYSGFSSSVTLTRASDADWDVITTGSAYLSCWFKCTGNSSFEHYIGFNNSGGTIEFELGLLGAGTVRGKDDGATAQTTVTSTQTFDNSVWHKADFVRVSSTERYLYVDGVLVASDTTDAGSLSSSGNLPLGIGCNGDATNNPATTSTLSLARLSATAPTATQIRQMYDAEKGMFVASAKCLLQSGSTDAVLDVSVDPITSKVAVTQTDSQMIWDGLVVDSTPAVNAGASEHNLLYGGDRVEINSVNLYATIAAKSLRGDLEIVRGMKAGLPAGVDLSKAKAWAYIIGSGTPVFAASYNIKSLTDKGVGSYRVDFAIPFKSINYVSVGNSVIGSDFNNLSFIHALASRDKHHADYYITRADTGAYIDDVGHCVLFFGELENE